MIAVSPSTTVLASNAQQPPRPGHLQQRQSIRDKNDGNRIAGRSSTASTGALPHPETGDSSTLYVTKRSVDANEPPRRELFDARKVRNRLEALTSGLDLGFVDLASLTSSVQRGVYPNVTTDEIDVLLAESAASLSTQHHDYARLAARILLTLNRKTTPSTFSDCVRRLYDGGRGFVDRNFAQIVEQNADTIDQRIQANYNDKTNHVMEMTYFGFRTLERAYLLRDDDGRLLERPEYMMMRVAIGLHGPDLEAAFETYDLLSRGIITHASPTLFHAGTTHPQLSSCFLLQMSHDSIHGIYDTLKRCAVISKAAGGIGLAVHNIRARGTPIHGTRGVSNGLVPMLRVYDATSRYVDQGGGKRPGAFAIYLEPWHADIFDVLNLKKNHGKEEQRARDLFYGLWIPDLFMKRVQDDGVWSLMCPHQSPGLQHSYGPEFERLYCDYERQGKFRRQVRARELWGAILESQIETGTPYMLYKDSCNSKSNQQNVGTIQCSNLCTEIIQYTDEDEVAVCNLASICLPKFVVSDSRRSTFGSSMSGTPPYFDHQALHRVTKIVTRNLNKIIDINSYPVDGSRRSNLRHRPVGIGVSGLADAFLRMGLPYASPEAKQLNEAIFETIYHAAVEASAELAEQDGPYESFAGSPASRGLFQFQLWGASDEDTPSHRCHSRSQLKQNPGHPSVEQKYVDDGTAFEGYDWDSLRKKVMTTGLRNSLLVAPMPTASTSQILGVNECFEPYSSNLYIRRVKAGEFIMTNPHLISDLTDRGLWTPAIRNQVMRDSGSVQNVAVIPDRLKELYKTVWEMKMKDVIDMAADRGKFVDQSQSLNLFLADPTVDKLTAMHFYAWRKGLKTGMYYLRTKPAVNAIQYTVDKSVASSTPTRIPEADDDDIGCLSCQV